MWGKCFIEFICYYSGFHLLEVDVGWQNLMQTLTCAQEEDYYFEGKIKMKENVCDLL